MTGLNAMSKPDFFIVGAPKSGTTALYTYLSSHPDIFFPSHKEPNFFAEDYPNIGGRLKTLDEYERLYVDKQHKQAGDASVCYLSSNTAPRAIRAYNPEARIIIMLRNPVDLFLSEHSQLIYSFYEDVSDPYKAWQLQPLRAKGQYIPPSCREAQVLQYRKVCSLGKNLNEYRKCFSEDKILTIFFEDFVRSPKESYQKVLRFLGLKDDGKQDFLKINEAKHHRYTRFSKWLIAPPGVFGKVHEKVRRYIATSEFDGLKKIENLARRLVVRSSVKQKPPRLSEKQFRMILSDLQDDIDLLASLTGRDLSAWKTDTI